MVEPPDPLDEGGLGDEPTARLDLGGGGEDRSCVGGRRLPTADTGRKSTPDPTSGRPPRRWPGIAAPCRAPKPPAPGGAGGGGTLALGVPDQGEDVVVVLAGGATQLELEGARAKVGMGQGQADIFPTRDLADVEPAAA